jgi:hypothetical protein
MSTIRRGPSPRLMKALFVLGVGLLFYGEYYYASGRRVYGVEGSAVPTLAGLAVLIIDCVLVVIWRAFRDRPTALEELVRRDDRDT